MTEVKKHSVEVVTYHERYRAAFKTLNLAWIEAYFVVEEADRTQLDDPVGQIVTPGGEVFFVLERGDVKGTCALIKKSDDVYELAKMAVNKSARGRGYSNRLMEAVIDGARKREASVLMLESNTILEPAIRLYRKYGFLVTPLDDHSEYGRANIRMELRLVDQPLSG